MTAAADALGSRRGSPMPFGRPFVSPLFDLMLIGGGLSLVTIVGLSAVGRVGRGGVPADLMLTIILLANSSHFAASTVRLYTKPGSYQSLPGMTMLFPLISLAVVALGLAFPGWIGSNIYKLYLTWSPYHYAAQTYGLAAMYAMRSGCTLSGGQRDLLWYTCMLPFVYAFLQPPTAGLGWFVPPSFFVEHPWLLELRWQVVSVLRWVVFAAPLLLVARVHQRSPVGLPFISLALILTNAIWWAALDYLGAIVWATVYHGVQYLAIVIIFHLRDHPPQGGGRAAWVLPALKFYGMCVALAYVLFEVWPWFFTLVGFSFAESALMCVAVINVHHFIVDRGIWRVRKDAANLSNVER